MINEIPVNAAATTTLTAQDYKDQHPVWCPGCGDFGVLDAMAKAFSQLNLHPKDITLVSGIGCSGRTPGFMKCYGIHTVHGRVLPVSMGVKLANPKLSVVGVGGDGDAFAIGGGHIPHAARRNIDVTYIVMDNSIYGLTKGQFSPTSPLGLEAGSTPYGSTEEPLNPLALTIAYGASFVARGYSGKPKELTDLIVRAMTHKGFAFIDVISPCITFYNTYKTIPQQIAPVPQGHDASNQVDAFKLSHDTSRMYLGVFYEAARPTYEERLLANVKKAAASGVPRLDEIMAEFA